MNKKEIISYFTVVSLIFSLSFSWVYAWWTSYSSFKENKKQIIDNTIEVDWNSISNIEKLPVKKPTREIVTNSDIKNKVWKNAENIEKRMNNLSEKFEKKSKNDKIKQLENLRIKIDKMMEKFVNTDISDQKKEAYRNLFEYIRYLNEEKIIILEKSIEKTSTWEVIN